MVILATALLSMLAQGAWTIDKQTTKSNAASTVSEGLLLGSTPTFVDFTGFNGLELAVSRPRTSRYDYTIMFWVRSKKSYDELKVDDGIKDIKTYLFKLENSVGCYITRTDDVGPMLYCETSYGPGFGGMIEVDLFDLPDIESWMHLTYSAIYKPASRLSGIESESYLRIDISTFNQEYRGAYKPVASDKIYYGCGGPLVTDVGFPGHYRQFWITVGYIEPDNVPNLAHEYKVLDYSSMAYYRFDQSIFIERYDDAFRVQNARPVSVLPSFVQENIAAPFCNSIPPEQVQVPQFYRASGSKYADIAVPAFKFKGRYIGYTASFWMKNFGAHAYQSNPSLGRNQNHIFKLDECFALWYDSKTSFRVYVYARDNFYETYSDPVFLPLNEWVNIQVAISQQSGITVMTFNQNGERQQLIQNKSFLAEQYPKGTISYFQSFIGIPYKLYIWEQFIELPVDFDDPSYSDRLLVAHDFTQYTRKGEDSSSFEGWKTLVDQNGQDFAATKGDGFDFVIDNVPSNANFRSPVLKGQLQSTSTDWDVTCPAPENSLMYLGGEGAGFDISVFVEKTDTYTVEFWFKADVTAFSQVSSQSQKYTFLYMMNGRSDGISKQQLSQYATNVMVIYVENEELKCAPFGFDQGEPKDPDTVLTYTNVKPLKVYEWQHISCVFLRQKYVKGQYLAINLQGQDSFRDETLRPQTFAKTIFKRDPVPEILILNQQLAQRWNVILGNNVEREMFFFGSFKDVRLWKQSRTDAELYSFRFNQVDLHEDLEGNLKFMDGSFDVYNDADTAANGPKYPKTEGSMSLLPTDKSNIICAADLYFNPEEQVCTRYPFTADPSIVYMVVNNIQHGHLMIIERMLKSSMTLPGPKFQPRSKTKWSIVKPTDAALAAEAQAIQDKYFQDRGRDSYELDPIIMGDYKNYTFEIAMNDVVNHNFFLFMRQTVIPRKCLQVVDFETKAYKRSRRVELNKDTEDLIFQVQVQRIDGCADEYLNKLQKDLRIEAQPPLPQEIKDGFEPTPDLADGRFDVRLRADLLKDPAMPKNIPINIIFYLFWSSAERGDQISYMNVVYTVTLASRIDVKIDYGSDRVIDIQDGRDLTINAICSSFYDTDTGTEAEDKGTSCAEYASSSGLSYRWECQIEGELETALEVRHNANIADYCEEWTGSPVIVIPNTLIVDNNALNKPIRIRVVVSSIEASEQTGDAAGNLQFRSSDADSLFTWVNQRIPYFDIEFPYEDEEADSDNDVVLVTKEQRFRVIPRDDAWRPQDGFDIIFNITDTEGNVIKATDPASSGLAFLDVPAQTFESDTTYQIQVSVKRRVTAEQEEMNLGAEHKPDPVQFRTGSLPPEPTVVVSPETGSMYDTEFNVVVSVDDPTGLTYLVLGLLSDGTEVKLTDTPRELAKRPKYTGTFPQIDTVKIELQNEQGEVVYGTTSVTVNKNEASDWVRIVGQYASQYETGLVAADDLWQNFLFIAADANLDATSIIENSEKSAEERKDAMLSARTVNALLAERAFQQIRGIEQKSIAEGDRKVVTYILGTISKISAFSQFMEPAWSSTPKPDETILVIQRCVETLEYILRIENIMEGINKDKVLREDFVKALGQLLDVVAVRAQIQKALLKYEQTDAPTLAWTEVEKAVQELVAEEEASDPAPEDGDGQEAPAEPTERFLAPDEWHGEPYSPEELRLISRNRRLNEEESTEIVLTADRQNNEDLLVLYRDLILKIIVLKNEHLDQLCLLDAAKDGPVTIKTGRLQQSVRRIFGDILPETHKDEVFTYENEDEDDPNAPVTQVTVTVPSQQLLKTSQDVFTPEDDFQWMCLQSSFIKPNPAAGFEPDDGQQFFFANQRFIQLGVVDNNQNRLLEDSRFKDASVTMEFKQKMNVEDYFFRNQTFCAHYDSNIDTGDHLWTDKKFDGADLPYPDNIECKYDYTFPKKSDFQVYGKIRCTCERVNNYYYTILTDLTRIKEIPQKLQNDKHTVLQLIQLPLILIGLIFPCLMIILDGKDYQNIEDHVYPVDDLTIAQLEYATDRLCKQQLYYNEKEISSYLSLAEGDFRSGSCVAFSTYHRALHPYFSLFSRFDYRSKRLTRFALVLGQISLITILQWFAYSHPATRLFSELLQMDEELWIERRWFFVSVALSLVTLPMPDKCCCFFKTTMYLLNDHSQIKTAELLAIEEYMKGGKYEVKKTGEDEENEEQKDAADKDQDEDALTEAGKEEVEPDLERYVRPALFDKFLWCKLVLMILLMLFWILAIVATLVLGDLCGIEYSKEERRADAAKDFILLTPDQATEFVLVWFLTIFVWGVILNELRILIITLLAPIQAQNLLHSLKESMRVHHINVDDEKTAKNAYDREEKKKKEEAEKREKQGLKPIADEGDSETQKVYEGAIETRKQSWSDLNKIQSGLCSRCSCYTVCFIPSEAVDIALDALLIIDIRKLRHTNTYWVKEHDRNLIEPAWKEYMFRDSEKAREDPLNKKFTLKNQLFKGAETELATSTRSKKKDTEGKKDKKKKEKKKGSKGKEKKKKK